MRILWVSTSPIGPASRILDMPNPGSSGGWIQSEYDEFISSEQSSGNQMFFLCASHSVAKGDLRFAESKEGKAFCVNLPKVSLGRELPNKTSELIQNIISEIAPDIIHIWGTESCISYGVAKLSNGIKKIVYLQGIIGIHSRYKGGYLERNSENKKYLKGISAKKRLIARIKKTYFKKQIEYERFILSECKNVIIDNDFSAAYCSSIDSSIKCYYHYLKPASVFASAEWYSKGSDSNRVFTVFGQSPEKGLHQLLKAIVIVKRHIPDITIIVPGPFNCENGKLRHKAKLSFYEAWLSTFIRENDLTENVVFVGKLDVFRMLEEIKRCSVFINPSCMEVHALSLREAMTVGAPCISSLCGSVPEFMSNGENGYIYRYEEYEMLAYLIEKVLGDITLREKLSQKARESMLQFSNMKNSLLVDIYNEIITKTD